MSPHVVFIGNGISAVTAARHLRRQGDARITLVSDETDHFFSRTALMYVYMGHLRPQDLKPYEDGFWAKNRIELVRDHVEEIDTGGRRLRLRRGPPLGYDVLVLATGSVPNRFGWPGEDLGGVQGLYGWPDLERMTRDTQGIERAVVVGGGLIGIEMAEMLHSRQIPVTFLVREQAYLDHVLPAEESELVRREVVRHGIDLRLGTELRAILPDASGRARAVVTSSGDEVTCSFVGLTAGVRPNVGVAAGSGVETNRGVLVDAFFRTNVPDVYAIGDCAEFRQDGIGHRRVEQLWYSGRRHGETLARTLAGRPTPYDRGVFFNSAKFFTVEWQTYGDVPAQAEPTVEAVVWQHPEEAKLVRIAAAAGTGRVLGFNVMGVRYRHEVCARWIREGRTLPYVLRRLGEANFDPELFTRYERHLVAAYNARHPDDPVAPARRPGLLARLRGRRAEEVPAPHLVAATPRRPAP